MSHLCLKRLAPLEVTFTSLVVTLHDKELFFLHIIFDIGYKKIIDKLAIIFIGVQSITFLLMPFYFFFSHHFFHVLNLMFDVHVKLAKKRDCRKILLKNAY